MPTASRSREEGSGIGPSGGVSSTETTGSGERSGGKLEGDASKTGGWVSSSGGSFSLPRILRSQLHYFTEGEIRDREKPNDYFFPLDRTAELLDEGVFYVTSPLDDQNQAEIEITAEPEDFLDWLVLNEIERVHVSET